jgi:uncharacterized protein (DUF4415 family)
MPTHFTDDTPYNAFDDEAVDNFWEGATITLKGKVVGKATRGSQKNPKKTPISIRLSQEVIDYFKSTGDGWQTRIDDILKQHIHS